MKTQFISFLDYKRFPTNEVKVGNVGIGGKNPIRIQTMTNTKTSDIEATYNQILQIYKAGADLVRVSVPNKSDVDALKKIKQRLVSANIHIPIIADIHFNPSLAEAIAPYVEKVRINPGNYVNRSKSAPARKYSIQEEQKELDDIRQRIAPLLNICKKHDTAIRIGVNFASLSWRIINKYGNTPFAMVQSAIEFIEICRTEDFHKIIVSLKASDIHSTIYANRLFVEEIAKRGWYYPIHVGITEAGLDMEGRIKSAIGIGSLLCDGIGDTIRVSITEAPEKEIPVAKEIINILNSFIQKTDTNKDWKHQPFSYKKRYTQAVSTFIGGKNPVPYIVLAENDKLSNDWVQIQNSNKAVRIDVFESDNVFDVRQKVYQNLESDKPIYLYFEAKASVNNQLIRFAIICGTLLSEGLIDGIILKCQKNEKDQAKQMVEAVLQITGARRFGNEYISCPSCSRTQFDIEKAVREVKKATQKFTGFKIAIMGCIVNGPGEMQDADFGFVGTKKNKVILYKKGNPITKDISFQEAIFNLVNLLEAETSKN